ncbi:MAG: hypothetical protein NTW38_09380, partial [Candidatus Aminicenantes bacterium]|nr:hypothetical protein [Candidatus Aminicenantes bacterium]
MKITHRWFHCVLLLIALVLLGLAPVFSAAPYSDILGSVWQESENGWSGVWTRRGTSDVFDAVWTLNGQRVTAVLTMTRTGLDTVSIYRKDTSSDNLEVDYAATIGGDGSVTGSGKIRSTGFTYTWTARVQGNTERPVSDILGSVWQ